ALGFQDQKHLLSDMYSLTLASQIEHALHEKGYGLLLNLTEEPNQQDRQLRSWVGSRAVDGVLLDWAPGDHPLLTTITRTVPVVVIGHEAVTGLPRAESVLTGLDRGARQVARHLVELGHRHIGYIGSRVPEQVMISFRDELAACGIVVPEETI